MEWNKDNLEDIVKFINEELNSGKPMVKIEKEVFGANERVIHKRLIRLGYKKIDNQYISKSIITSNITDNIKKNISCNISKEPVKNDKKLSELNIEEDKQYDIEKDKLQILIDNLDDLLNLVKLNKINNTSNITNIRSGIADVKSFRIDSGIYAEIKRVAHEREENIGEIINKALEEYLIKYGL